MKQKIIFLIVLSPLLAACSTGQIQVPEQPAEVNSTVPLPSQPTATPVTKAITQPAASTDTAAPNAAEKALSGAVPLRKRW